MTEFLNRQPHLRRLSELFEAQDSSKSRLVVAVGHEGVGKSALVKRAADTVASSYCYVYCDRTPSSEGTFSSRALSELLERRLTALAPEYGFGTFEKFHARGRVKEFLKHGSKALVSIAAKSTLPDLASDFLHETYKEAGAWANRRKGREFHHHYADDKRLMYALKVFQSTPSIVHVDHANHLDEHELEVLIQLLDSTQIFLFLEYTYKGERGNLSLPARLLERKLLTLNVDPLGDGYIDRLFSVLPARFSQVLRKQFVVSGDLRPYDEALAIHSRDKNFQEIFDITEESLTTRVKMAIKALEPPYRDLLLAIACHGGPVDLELLTQFIKHNAGYPVSINVPDLGKALGLLDDEVLVIITQNDIACQVRAYEYLKADVALTSREVAFKKAWRDFYRDVAGMDIFVSDEDRCRQLLYQCAELSDLVGITKTLEEIGKRGISTRNPKAIVSYIKNVIGKLSLPSEDRAILRIIKVQSRFFYEAGWFDEALSCLQIFGVTSKRYRFLLAELLCSTGHQNRGIALADSHLSEIDSLSEDADGDELCLRLIKMHGLRSSNRLKEARELYLRTIEEERFESFEAFTVLLRFADMCLYKDEDMDECIAHLRRAVSLTKERKLFGDHASACISLAQQLGYSDAFDEAERLLHDAELAAEYAWFQQAPLLANKAVLSIYRGNVEPEGLQLLQQALVLSYDPLDRILIQTNLLVWHALANGIEEALSISDLLVEQISSPGVDGEIARIAMYNIEQLQRQAGHGEVADKVYEKWSAIHTGIDETYWSYRRKRLIPKESQPARYKMRFYPVYLAHWHIGFVPFEAIRDDT